MTDDLIEISKRAVACRGWQWMPGMLAALDGIGGDYRARVCRVDNGLFWSDATPLPYALASYVPDLSDPATLGCLLALVRKAWGDPTLCVVLDTSDGRWCVGCWEDNGIAMRGRGGATETEALVNALEGAP